MVPIPNLSYSAVVPFLWFFHRNCVQQYSEVNETGVKRQAILTVLQATSRPLGPKELAAQTGQDRPLVRQVLRRMLNAGDILFLASDLYMTHHHLSPEPVFSHNNSATPTTPTTPATPATLATLPHYS